MRALSRFLYVSILIYAGAASAQDVQKEPKTLDDLAKSSALQDISLGSENSMRLNEVVVSGTRLFDGYYIQAERLVFKSDAVLSFSKRAQGMRSNLFIVAREIVSEDPANPGTITYERSESLPTPAMPGQAPTGQAGGHRQRGGQGMPGQQGVAGAPGATSPSLTVTVMQVPGSGPIIDLRGGGGGQGGQGQKGGDGGGGGRGDNASQSAFDCKRGAENGYSGGQGGAGGQGGTGGQGGNGGTFTLLTFGEGVTPFLQKFRVLISAGGPGAPGDGGPGGNGGPGGSGGADARPYCRGSGSQGPTGGIGPSGPRGAPGTAGVDGDIFIGSIDAKQFDRLYKTN